MNNHKRGLLLLLLTAPILFTACGKSGAGDGSHSVVFGSKDQVRYEGAATEQDAQKLGNALKSVGLFTDQGVTVVLSKGPDGTAVGWQVKDGMWDDPTYVAKMEQATRILGPVLGGLPVKCRFLNAANEVKKETVVRAPVIIGTKDSIVYSGDATEQDAKALGTALQKAGYFDDSGASVLLSKGHDGTVLSFVVDETYWSNEAKVNELQETVRSIATEIGGLPVNVKLVNTILEPKKEFPVT